MDPLSITTGVIALLGACITTGIALKEFYDGAATANLKVKGLLTDVESFTQVLRLMKETLEQENIQSSLQSTGHIGNHWNDLSTSIRDGQSTLCQLKETIEKANKSVSLLDGPRRHLRLKGAADEIAVYQQQIRSYRDTLQLSLQTVILWNQVTVRESTDKILPNLDEIHQAIRRIAFDINDRISGLQNVIESKTSDHELRSLNNLRNCVKSAASVVSSASTTLGVENSGRLSVTYGSEFGDCFPPEPSETMLRWISSNTVNEFEEEKDTESSFSGPKPASGKSLELVDESQDSDQSDSDGELEAEIIQSLLRRGKDKLASQEFEDAERHFRNCLSRASSNGSSVSLHRLVGPTSEIMTLLLTTYRHQEKWDEAHSLLIEKIAVESRGSSKSNQGVLADMLTLVEVLFQKSAYAEALLHGRRALKSYRKLGSEGIFGVQDSLKLLCKVCKAAGNHDEEDAYGAILSDILQQSLQKPAIAEVSVAHDSEPDTTSTASTIKGIELMKEASTQSLGSPDALDSINSWVSSDQLTPSSATRTHHRGSSLSSSGSARPASPSTTFTSFSAASRESSSTLKESSLPDSTKIYVPESPPPSGPEDTVEQSKGTNESPLLSGLEDTVERSEGTNELPHLPANKSTNTVTVTPESSQVNVTVNPQESTATDGASTGASPPSNILKRQKSKIPQFVGNHFQKNLEETAIKYFREKKGNPPKPVIPTPRIPIPVSDYELPQWIGTLQLDSGPSELPTVSLDPPKKLIQKSKSATDLFDLGVVELPAESLQKSRSTINLHEWSTMPASVDRSDPAKTTPAVNEDDWDAIFGSPGKSNLLGTDRPDTTRNASTVNDKDDWDAIFACFNRPVITKDNSTVNDKDDRDTIFDRPVRTGASSGIKNEVQTNQGSGIDSSTALPESQIGTAFIDKMKTLTEMGYPRSKALDVLEKCDYNLVRAADYLVNESSEEPNPRGSQVKLTGSQSVSSTSNEKRMGVQDFHFFVTPVPETAEALNASTTNLGTSSSFGPQPRPVSFQTLVQLQSKRTPGGSYLDRPGPAGLTTYRSEPSMTEQARSHKKNFSLQDELSEANKRSRPRNPIATHFDVNSNLPVELPAHQPFVANDLSMDLATLFSSKSEETRPSNTPSFHNSQNASTGDLSTTPAVKFSDMLTDRDAIRRKLVIAGDPFCGKSSLCSVFSKGIFPGTYHSTELETGMAHIEVDGKRIELVLWDTGGDCNISGIRLQCYPDSHVVLLCFAIDSPDSLENAEELFTKELQKAYNCSARYMLVGLKADLRFDWETMKRLKTTDQHTVTANEARAVSLRIGAAKYVECSAKTGESVKDVFDAAARLALMPGEKIKKMRSFRRLFGKE